MTPPGLPRHQRKVRRKDERAAGPSSSAASRKSEGLGSPKGRDNRRWAGDSSTRKPAAPPVTAPGPIVQVAYRESGGEMVPRWAASIPAVVGVPHAWRARFSRRRVAAALWKAARTCRHRRLPALPRNVPAFVPASCKFRATRAISAIRNGSSSRDHMSANELASSDRPV